jgi:hypothetical protein
MQIRQNFPAKARELLLVRGRDLLRTLGLPALRSVVVQVLSGVNIRDATETLTQRRIGLLNAAILDTYASLATAGLDSSAIIDLAYEEMRSPQSTPEDKIVLRWMLGLTNKQVQNVLRSDAIAWERYVEKLKETSRSTAKAAEELYGDFPLSSSSKRHDWEWGLSLLTAVGAQTLGTRGSEKSLYGKFFEKLVLGSVLSVLGFRLTAPDNFEEGSFILSSTAKRESDATAVWNHGQGVRFDIGFIGRGNTEITLDKVTRFARVDEINGQKTHFKTVIIVDVVGKNSSIVELASEVDGVIIQMSASDWVQTLGGELENCLDGFKSPVGGVSHSEYLRQIQAGVDNAPLEEIFRIAADPDEGDEEFA